MPNPRRTSRYQHQAFPTKPKIEKPTDNSSVDGDHDNPLASILLSPRHAHLPEIGLDSNLLFEGFVFVFGTMGLVLQYINLYKTVWWLPHSHSNYALNFYLIDPYLSALLVVIMGRRMVYVFLKEFYSTRPVWTCCMYMVKTVKVLVGLSLAEILCYCVYHVVLQYSLLYSLFLCYPLATYVVLFGFSIEPLFGKRLVIPPSPASDRGGPGGTPKHRGSRGAMMVGLTGDGLYKELPVHVCSMTPEVVRDEVEGLKTDFNGRIKQVLFNSMTCAYYMGFVPLCFAQNTLYYDTWWVGQHVCLIWISSFVMFMVHFLPAKYLDTLHQAALHLGKWVKVEGRHAHVPYNAWSELQVWQKGALVKHVKGLFKAEGINNSAEPGNSMHARFNFMFHCPCRLTNWLLIITWCVVLYQFWLLIQSTEWSHIVSLAFMLFCNYYVLFKLMRDRLVMGKAYKEELS